MMYLEKCDREVTLSEPELTEACRKVFSAISGIPETSLVVRLRITPRREVLVKIGGLISLLPSYYKIKYAFRANARRDGMWRIDDSLTLDQIRWDAKGHSNVLEAGPGQVISDMINRLAKAC